MSPPLPLQLLSLPLQVLSTSSWRRCFVQCVAKSLCVLELLRLCVCSLLPWPGRAEEANAAKQRPTAKGQRASEHQHKRRHTSTDSLHTQLNKSKLQEKGN